MKRLWQPWLGLLLAVNLCGPVYFFNALEGKVVLAAFLASAALMIAIFAIKGFVRLLGTGHIFWIPLLPWLWARLDQVEAGDLLWHWIVAVIVVDGISLIIDAVDILRYVRGDRAPSVQVPN